jgi:hypothetical protein
MRELTARLAAEAAIGTAAGAITALWRLLAASGLGYSYGKRGRRQGKELVSCHQHPKARNVLGRGPHSHGYTFNNSIVPQFTVVAPIATNS